MPAYSFSRMEFVEKILDGSKPHTVRRRRKNPTKVGDVLYLYYKQRTPECRAIGVTVCRWVLPMVIYVQARLVKLNGHILPIKKLQKLAQMDGFDDIVSFFEFFEQYGKDVLDDFVLVEWDPRSLVKAWDLNGDPQAKMRMASLLKRGFVE